MKKIHVDELKRLAFIGAEQDSRALAEAWPRDSEESKDATDLADRFLAYRLKHWGETEFEGRVKFCKPVSIFELAAQGGPDRGFGDDSPSAAPPQHGSSRADGGTT